MAQILSTLYFSISSSKIHWHIEWQIVYWGKGQGDEIGVAAQQWAQYPGYRGSIPGQDSSLLQTLISDQQYTKSA